MIRSVQPGEQVVDQFPAFEDDGYSKRSGLAFGDFTFSTFHDGSSEYIPVVVAEIGSVGEYKVEYTPPTDGLWVVQVLIDFNKAIWQSVVEASVGDVSTALVEIRDQVDKIDLAPTRGPSTVVSGSLMDRVMNKDGNKSYDPLTDSLEAIRDRMG